MYIARLLLYLIPVCLFSVQFSASPLSSMLEDMNAPPEKSFSLGISLSSGIWNPSDINKRIEDFLEERQIIIESGISELGVYYTFGALATVRLKPKLSLTAGINYSLGSLHIIVSNSANHSMYYDRVSLFIEPVFAVHRKFQLGLGFSYNYLNYREDWKTYSTATALGFNPQLIFPLGGTSLWSTPLSASWFIGVDLCRAPGENNLTLDYSMLSIGAMASFRNILAKR